MAEPDTLGLPRRDMHSALVTGATGFIGGHLVRSLLDRGVNVSVLARDPARARDLESLGARVFRGDVTDPDSLPPAVEGTDTVFHAAAVLGPSHLSMSVYRSVNRDGTANLMHACRNSGCLERFVLISSVGVLGPLKPRETAGEGTPPRPVDKYEITKLEAEELVLRAAETGFPAVIARPAWAYGPGDTRTLKIFRAVARRRLIMVGNGDNKQHPVFIDDLIDGLIRCAEIKNVEGRVYHLGGPERIRVCDLLKTIADAAETTIPPVRLPVWLVMIPAYLVEWIFSLWNGDPPLDHRKADFFRIQRAYSIRRAEQELGFAPQTRFADGAAATVAWYRANNKL